MADSGKPIHIMAKNFHYSPLETGSLIFSGNGPPAADW